MLNIDYLVFGYVPFWIFIELVWLVRKWQIMRTITVLTGRTNGYKRDAVVEYELHKEVFYYLTILLRIAYVFIFGFFINSKNDFALTYELIPWLGLMYLFARFARHFVVAFHEHYILSNAKKGKAVRRFIYTLYERMYYITTWFVRILEILLTGLLIPVFRFYFEKFF